jgi:uncharacterized protein with PIN domain
MTDVFCSYCGGEMVEISAENLLRSLNKIRATIRSIPPKVLKQKRSFYPICPKCDAYALGAEWNEGIPFVLRDGRTMTVHELFGDGKS